MAVRDVIQAAAGIGGAKLYAEDVFSTYLYTGNDSTQTITNGIDLAGEGGLVWVKSRAQIAAHELVDTVRGADNRLFSNLTSAQDNSGSVHAFNSNGFTLRAAGLGNLLNEPTASWTFRKAPKFFDVVTYTGNGATSRTISHNLGSAPGVLILKNVSNSSSWSVFHRSLGVSQTLLLNDTAAAFGASGRFGSSAPTATTFDINDIYNTNGETYVAYLFAHNAGGFGDDGLQNVISCGSYTGNGSATGPVVTLGYEPQWLLVKPSTFATDWSIIDNMRGAPWGSEGQILQPNTSAATTNRSVKFNPTGFQPADTFADFNRSGTTYIYIAIRRPMKTPESGTEVYKADISNGSNPEYVAGFPIDMSITGYKTGGSAWYPTLGSRLLQGTYLQTANTSAQDSSGQFMYDYQNSWYNGSQTSGAFVSWMFRRAPGFFDVVCYTGNAANPRSISHNLGVKPEILIIKDRSNTWNWHVFYDFTSTGCGRMFLNLTNSQYDVLFSDTGQQLRAEPTATDFTVGSNAGANASGDNYVAYLFASLPGISKVGSYTGTGTTQQINCGFTSGARFVLIKRTDSTGDWYVWDSARGIVSGNDPYLLLNSTAAENTSTDYIDPYSAGFEISSTAPAAINASGGSYVFLAIS